MLWRRGLAGRRAGPEFAPLYPGAMSLREDLTTIDLLLGPELEEDEDEDFVPGMAAIRTQHLLGSLFTRNPAPNR